MRIRFPQITIVVFAAFSYACSSGGDPESNNISPQSESAAQPSIGAAEEKYEVGLDIDLSAFLLRESVGIDPSSDGLQNDQANLLSGDLLVSDLSSGQVELYDWIVNLDSSSVSANVQSFKKLLLSPGDYVVAIAVGNGDQQFAGDTLHTVFDGEQDDVAITIRPVIGEGFVDATVVSTLIDFRFNYSEGGIAEAGLFDPSIGIQIDSDAEQIYAIDQDTGLSEPMLLNMIPGDYEIVTKLYDGGAQVGKSIGGPSNLFNVQAGVDLAIDIEPLYGEIGVTVSPESGVASFLVVVPPELEAAVGGLSNLQSTISMVGVENPLQEVQFSPEASDFGYSATVEFSNVNFGDVNIELSFLDVNNNLAVAGCVDQITLNNVSATLECALTLRTNQFVSGIIYATIGVNVVDSVGMPVAGAVLSVDGQDVAITDGDSGISAPGFAKLYLKPGLHEITATSGGGIGTITLDVNPLDVDTIDLVIEEL